MKKTLLLLLLAFCLVFSFAYTAFAASTTECSGTCAHEAAIGSTHYDTLAEAISGAQAGDTVTLLSNISSSAIVLVDKSITLDGNNKTLTSSANRAININCADEVEVKNLTIATTLQASSDIRAINVIQKAAKLTLTNINAEGFKYTINVAASSVGSNIAIHGGSYSGYAALNIIGNNTAVTATDVEFIGVNPYDTPESNSFTVISVGDGTSNKTTDGVSISISGGSVTANATADAWQFCFGFGVKADGTGNAVSNLSANMNTTWILDGENTAYFCIPENTPAKYITGGSFTEDVSAYCAEGYTGNVKVGDVYIVHKCDEKTVLDAVCATCTVDGKTEGAKCSVCGTVTKAQQTIPAAHTLTKIDAKAPTYTEAGNIEHHYCSVCKKLFVNEAAKDELTAEQVIVPMLIKVEEEKAEVSLDAVDKAITEAAKNETSTEIVLDLNKVAEDAVEDTTEKPAEVVSVQLPVASLEKVAELHEEATLTVVMKEATVTMDAATLEAVTKQAEGSTVTLVVEQIPVEELTEKQQAAVENKEVVATISAQIICDTTGNTIHDFEGGNVTVQIPFAPEEGTKGEDYAVYYVADDGSVEKIATKYVDGHLVVTLEHFSEYVIVNTKANADPSNPATGALSMAPVMALLVINSIGAGALIIGKKRFF